MTSVIWIVVAVLSTFTVGYVGYSRYLSRFVDLDDERETPAHKYEDGQEYVPAKKPVLLGHHFSSIAGGAPIVGPKYDEGRIPGIQVALEEGDSYALGNAAAKVFFTPGHTRGHICFWFEDADVLFSGDTLFALGCGRLFEGSPADMWESLQKLRRLPDTCLVFCGHEYTQTNARCARDCDPENAKLKAYADRIQQQRAAGKPTIPAQLGEEKACNPFLRADDPGLAQAIGMAGAAPVEVFAAVREKRNGY